MHHLNRYRLLTLIAVGALTLGGLAGCGKSEESKAPATAAEAAAQPLEGKAASKPSQFIGTWFCTTDGPLTGLEFLKDGKVLVSNELFSVLNGRGGVMLSYDVLEGGRLTLTAPNGQTQVFNAVLAGDQLELKGDGETHRYRRLAQGQTIAQAAKEHMEAKTRRYQENLAQLREYLGGKGLVLIAASPEAPEAGEQFAMALALRENGQQQYAGSAFHDGKVVVPTVANLQLIPNERTLSSRVQVNIQGAGRNVVGSNVTQGSFTLDTKGDGGALELTGPIRMGNVSLTARLVHDEARYNKILQQYEDQKAKEEALKQPVIDALKEFAILRGESAVQNVANQKTEDQIILVRDASPNAVTWRGEIQSANTATGYTQTAPFLGAGVVVENGKALLVIPGTGRFYQLSLQGKLTGSWHAGPNAPGYATELEIVEATDKATYDARSQAQRQALLNINQSQKFYGFVPAYGARREKTPVILTMEVTPEGQVVANAYYSLFRSNVLMTGQVVNSLIGPSIQLQFKDIPAGQQNVRISANMLSMRIRNQRWNLRLPDTGPTPRLVGHLSIAGQGTMEFTQYSDTWKAHLDTLLQATLKQGATFKVVHPARDNVEPTTITLKLDAAGQVTGLVATGGRHLNINAQSTLAGKVGDMQGWPGVALELTPPARGSKCTLELFFHQRDGEPVFTGVIYPSHAPQAETYMELERINP